MSLVEFFKAPGFGWPLLVVAMIACGIILAFGIRQKSLSARKIWLIALIPFAVGSLTAAFGYWEGCTANVILATLAIGVMLSAILLIPPKLLRTSTAVA